METNFLKTILYSCAFLKSIEQIFNKIELVKQLFQYQYTEKKSKTKKKADYFFIETNILIFLPKLYTFCFSFLNILFMQISK